MSNPIESATERNERFLKEKIATCDYFTVRPDKYRAEFVLHGFGQYPRSSVLAGQACKKYITTIKAKDLPAAIEVAKARFGELEIDAGHDLLDPQVSLNHLPGEDDPVPGGMFPDDWS